MGLRPAKTCRTLDKAAWTRFSKKKPRKSFVKALPHNALNIFEMGARKEEYELEVELVSDGKVQVRDNALESARQAVNKYFEKLLPGGYHFAVLVFPHNVIRENKMILGAGADRLQKGMRQAFGRPMDRAARIYPNQAVYRLRVMARNLDAAKEAYRRAKTKLPGSYSVRIKKLN